MVQLFTKRRAGVAGPGMIDRWTGLQRAAMFAAMALIAGCQVIPRGPPAAPPPPAPPPINSTLPSDAGRHRVALLLPMVGPNAAAGEAIANATTMALLDTNAANLRITTYDTSAGAPAAAARAVAEGNRLILGPLLGEEAVAVAQTARASHVPVISFSNDVAAAGNDVFVMGAIPGQSIARVVRYARAAGATRFAALIPVGAYGERASRAMLASVRASGGMMVGMEEYQRVPGALAPAVARLRGHGAFDAVLIADGGRMAVQAAALLRAGGSDAGGPAPRILGTELWSGDAAVARSAALNGAIYAGLSDARFHRFADSYKARFGTAPYRLATLGYDSVLLTLRVARDWAPDAVFPTARLYDRGGFLGLDGVFRFAPDGVIERALEVREVRGGSVSVVNAAPAAFAE